MRRPLIAAFCFLALAAHGHAATPRTPLTGSARITGAQAGKAIAVVIIPNSAISSSDEIIPDVKLKWRASIPVTVWRIRRIAGDPRLCPVATFQFEYVPGGLVSAQAFVIPASVVREFDSILFESRPWYSISISDSSAAGSAGSFVVLPADPSHLMPPGSRPEVINCSDDPRVTTHAALFKE